MIVGQFPKIPSPSIKNVLYFLKENIDAFEAAYRCLRAGQRG